MILPGFWESASVVFLVFIFATSFGRRIRLLGVPPWRFALGWRDPCCNGSALDAFVHDTGGLILMSNYFVTFRAGDWDWML